MTNIFYVEWFKDRFKPKTFTVKHYHEQNVPEDRKEQLVMIELHEEYSEDFKYQEEVLRSIRLIDNEYWVYDNVDVVKEYIKDYKNIKIKGE